MLDDFTIGLHAEIGEAQVRLSAFSTHHGSAASTAGNAVTKASMVATKRIAFESASHQGMPPKGAGRPCGHRESGHRTSLRGWELPLTQFRLKWRFPSSADSDDERRERVWAACPASFRTHIFAHLRDVT